MSEHAINGWTFKVEDDAGRPAPWVYKEVKNWNHNFAHEISIEKIFVEVEEDGKFETLSLKSSDFESKNGGPPGLVKHDLKADKHTVSLANFAVYKGNGLLLDLVTKKGVLPGKDEKGESVDEPLYIFITFLFAEYGNDPPHEFTGALSAARFTPAFHFQTMNKSVVSVRVHYRFHFDLDSYLQSASPLNKLVAELKKKAQGRENYALVVRDADDFPPSLMGVVGLLKKVFELYEGLKFFVARLDECGYGAMCRFQAWGLELELSRAGAQAIDQLEISFRDPRKMLADVSKALEKSSLKLTDERVVTLGAAGPAEYDQTLVDGLAATIFNAADPSLPGVSSECLLSYIKHGLVLLAIESYVLREGGDILKQLGPLLAAMKSDLEDVLKYLKADDVEKVFKDIADLVKSLLAAPLTPFLGSVIKLKKFARLAEDMQALAGKLISIVAFDAAEKPVLHELVGRFVNAGEVDDTWDNMHWWGTKKIPSAPGAFFAVHSHFRWTRLNAYPTEEETRLLEGLNAVIGTRQRMHLGAPQLRSLVKRFAENQLSGPLIDPKAPNQTVMFAFARNGSDLDRKLKESDEPFEDVGENASIAPEPIATVSSRGNTGADIVYWLSCKAERAGEPSFEGTLLINGFYFAHDEEKPFSLFRPANMFAPTEGIALQKPIRKEPYKLFRAPSTK